MKWFVLGLGVSFLLMAMGLVIYIHTESFDRWMRGEAIARINGLLRGSVSAERIEGSIWHHLVIDNVKLQYEDREILDVPRLEVSFSLLPLIWGEVRIASIVAAEPRAHFVQDSQGRWNVIEALSPRNPEPQAESQFTVLVRQFRLQNGAVEVRPSIDNGKAYDLRNLTLQGNIGIQPLGVSVNIDEVTADLSAPAQPELRLKGGLEYRQTATAPSLLSVKDLWAVSRNSHVKLNGEVTQGTVLKIKAEAAFDKLAPSDISYFVPQWPLKRELTGNVSVDGSLDDLSGSLRLAAGGARIAGKFRADLGQEIPRYSATATLSGFDLREWLNGKGLAGLVAGTLQIAANGLSLQSTTAKAQMQIQSAEAQSWKLGNLAVQGQLQNGVATLDGQLRSAMGDGSWSGKVILTNQRPTYDLNFTAKNFDVQKIAQNANGFKSKLNFRGTISGSGFTLADMNTHADVQIAPSSVGSVAIEQGAVNLSVRENTVRIARASLNTKESALSATGELGLGVQQSGKIDYRVRVRDLTPWMALVGRSGSGAVDLTGLAQGNLADLEVRGTAQLSGLRLDGIGVKDGSIRFALRGSKDQIFPRGSVTVRLVDVNAGLGLRRLDGNAKLSQPPQSIGFDVTAQDARGRKHSMAGAVDLFSDSITLRLTEAALTAPDGSWKLLHPATVIKRGEAFVIEQLALKNGEREVSVNGRFALSGKQDLSLSVNRLPVETLTGFLPESAKMSGLMTLQARLLGTAGAPELTVSARLSNAAIAGQAYAGADADAGYKDKQLSLRFIVRQDSSHSLSGTGVVPLNLSWSNGWRMDFADGLDVRARSTGLSVAFLNAFAGKSMVNIAGELSLDLSARGSVKAPDVRGTFRLRDGKFKLVPLGVDVNSVAVGGNLDSRMLAIQEFSANANGGEIRGSGALPLTNFEQSAIKLVLSVKNWPIIQTAGYQAKIAGNLALEGSLNTPKVTGVLTVLEGSLRPDLAVLEQSKVPLKRDDTIVVINQSAAREKAPVATEENTAFSGNQLFKKLSMDLTLRAPGNLWIRHPDLVSELSGNIHATKKPDADIDLTGRIDVVRGSLVFQGRRFQLSRGAIQFTGGGEINPSLDIEAEYKLPDYQVNAVLGGTAQKPALTLSSDPRLDQADILAVLLFGKPINSLDQNQRGSVQQSALNITSGFVAGQLANSVSQALGLDRLGLDVGEVNASGGQIGFGRYVGSNTYFSVSQELSGQRGENVSLDYQFAPDWKISTSRSSTGSNGIDVIWQKRY